MPKRSKAKEAVIVIVVDSELVAVGLTMAMSSRPDVHIAAVAHNAEAGWKAIERHKPDLVLIAPELARAVQLLSGGHWRTRTILLGRNPHVGVEPACGTEQVCGFVSYSARRQRFLPLIDTVAQCPLVQAAAGGARCGDCPARLSLALPALGLSGREYQVFVFIGRGFGSSDIASELGVSIKTVETHRESIKHKLGLGSARALNAAAAGWCRGEVIASDP
ncbi:DNA-binding NarL/FixJ family response regulator [Tahibacter aquaticus]|uniref:DNA-binding NarL/FixJ family response regulator n=1 Tax=Tahibacter aquaticus TaxID=520092 RepID=A0A4R6YYB0_9GAMM|nr:response regulator transcription factor [Tahibacter aquaticus]TDR44004.1 DNA-binding NarL/FixJ family response regulator [Tahibacter aquaticus]